MKIVIIHGKNQIGSTATIARMLAEKVGGEVTEFFLPRDFSDFCLGCCNCFGKGEELCPHRSSLKPIVDAVDASDLIILDSPVYVYHASGAMKTFLDHLAYRWSSHRPVAGMYKKQGVVISTAAGAGVKSAIKDMMDSMTFWGVGRRYSIGYAIYAVDWNAVGEKKKRTIERKVDRTAALIRKREGRVKADLKVKAWFYLMRLIQQHGWNPADVNYWKETGFAGSVRPWK